MTAFRLAVFAALAWSAAILIVFSARYAAPVLLIAGREVYRRVRA